MAPEVMAPTMAPWQMVGVHALGNLLGASVQNVCTPPISPPVCEVPAGLGSVLGAQSEAAGGWSLWLDSAWLRMQRVGLWKINVRV